jgi:serine/threonine protein kinase
LHPPSHADLSALFLGRRKQIDRDSTELIASIERLKRLRKAGGAVLEPAEMSRVIGRSEKCVVTLLRGAGGGWLAGKTADKDTCLLIGDAFHGLEREALIHKRLNHPLVLGFREFRREGSVIVTEFVGNGSLESHLPIANGGCGRGLRGANRIARIVVGIVLGMRHVHSRSVVHRDLRPDNILLDWSWNVRIADFGHSISSTDQHRQSRMPSVDWRYCAPECYDYSQYQPSAPCDVFSFALILYELVVGKPGISRELGPVRAVWALTAEDFRPEIPISVLPAVAKLITDCWAVNPSDRPSFEAILDRLEQMDFRITADVNPLKVVKFVEKVTAWEAAIASAD